MRLWDRRWRTTWEGPCYDWRCDFCINIIPGIIIRKKKVFELGENHTKRCSWRERRIGSKSDLKLKELIDKNQWRILTLDQIVLSNHQEEVSYLDLIHKEEGLTTSTCCWSWRERERKNLREEEEKLGVMGFFYILKIDL